MDQECQDECVDQECLDEYDSCQFVEFLDEGSLDVGSQDEDGFVD